MYDFDFQEVTCNCCACSSLSSNSPFPEPKFALLRAALSRIDPDCNYSTWVLIGAIIYNESGGSEEGLNLFNSWSGEGSTYRESEAVYRTWLSFNYDRPWPANKNNLTLILDREGVDWNAVYSLGEEEFFLFDELAEEES